MNEWVVPDGRRPSPHTWKQVAASLVSWFEFCEEIAETDWLGATVDTLRQYKHLYQSAIDPQSGDSYSDDTIKIRMSYTLEFYDFCREQGWYHGEISRDTNSRDNYQAPIDQDPLAHIRSGRPCQVRSAGPSLLPKGSRDDTIRVLMRNEWKALLRVAGPRFSERSKDTLGYGRDRLIIDIGWAVGLRRSEIAGLKTIPFLEIETTNRGLGERIPISVTGKGEVTRNVDFPVWLIQDIHLYINTERKRSLAVNSGKSKESALLLTHVNHRLAGNPLKPDSIADRIEYYIKKAGLVAVVERIDPDTGEVYNKQVLKHSTHSLRHTYACLTYIAEKESGNPSPWTYIQEQLRHVHSATTINIYLKYVHYFDDTRNPLNLLEHLR